ncbi:MAG: hypothetical protein JJE46_01535 [Acidimicrobiia bacterium]|nr:hypothetical protein [Acidimicrobiia bacterium]
MTIGGCAVVVAVVVAVRWGAVLVEGEAALLLLEQALSRATTPRMLVRATGCIETV